MCAPRIHPTRPVVCFGAAGQQKAVASPRHADTANLLKPGVDDNGGQLCLPRRHNKKKNKDKPDDRHRRPP